MVEPIKIDAYQCPVCKARGFIGDDGLTYEDVVAHVNMPVDDLEVPVGFVFRDGNKFTIVGKFGDVSGAMYQTEGVHGKTYLRITLSPDDYNFDHSNSRHLRNRFEREGDESPIISDEDLENVRGWFGALPAYIRGGLNPNKELTTPEQLTNRHEGLEALIPK